MGRRRRFRGICKFLRSLFRHGELHHRRLIAQAVGLIARLRIRNIRSVQHCIP